MKARTVLLSAVLLVIFVGCSTVTPDAALKMWIGLPIQNAVIQWGPPTRTITDGAGGQVMEWNFWVAGDGLFGDYGHWQTRSLYAHADGSIYNYWWKGF